MEEVLSEYQQEANRKGAQESHASDGIRKSIGQLLFLPFRIVNRQLWDEYADKHCYDGEDEIRHSFRYRILSRSYTAGKQIGQEKIKRGQHDITGLIEGIPDSG